MIRTRKQLLQSTTNFIEVLSSMTTKVPQVLTNNEEVLVQKTLMIEAYKLQIEADMKVFNLAKDYVRMMRAVNKAQDDRKAALLNASKLENKQAIDRDDTKEVIVDDFNFFYKYNNLGSSSTVQHRVIE